jgi:hypothetical protein
VDSNTTMRKLLNAGNLTEMVDFGLMKLSIK